MAHGRKELFLDLLAACQDEECWFAPLNVALAHLTAQEAAWHEAGSHSIWHIVNHLTFWNERWLRRWQGTAAVPAGAVENDQTFDSEEQTGDEAGWQAAVVRLNAVLSQWRTAIADCSEDDLDAPIPTLPADELWWGVISCLCTHNVYHIGHIVYIRKRQGTWKPTGG